MTSKTQAGYGFQTSFPNIEVYGNIIKRFLCCQETCSKKAVKDP